MILKLIQQQQKQNDDDDDDYGNHNDSNMQTFEDLFPLIFCATKTNAAHFLSNTYILWASTVNFLDKYLFHNI
jgi:hypothetical protein